MFFAKKLLGLNEFEKIKISECGRKSGRLWKAIPPKEGMRCLKTAVVRAGACWKEHEILCGVSHSKSDYVISIPISSFHPGNYENSKQRMLIYHFFPRPIITLTISNSQKFKPTLYIGAQYETGFLCFSKIESENRQTINYDLQGFLDRGVGQQDHQHYKFGLKVIDPFKEAVGDVLLKSEISRFSQGPSEVVTDHFLMEVYRKGVLPLTDLSVLDKKVQSRKSMFPKTNTLFNLMFDVQSMLKGTDPTTHPEKLHKLYCIYKTQTFTHANNAK